MNLIIIAIVLAGIAAFCDYAFGIKEPWRKIIYVGLIILFVVALVMLVLPGLLPLRF